MWLIIVITTLFDHAAYDPTVYTFQTFHTQKRCEAVAGWINKREIARLGNSATQRTEATCVFNGKEEQ